MKKKQNYDITHRVIRVLAGDYIMLTELSQRAGVTMAEALHLVLEQQGATIEIKTVENVRSLMDTKYESVGSVVGNLDSISVHYGTEFRVWDELSGRAVTCRFPKELIGKVKDVLGQRVLVYGLLKANYVGEKRLILVEGLDSYPEEAKLPTIEEMSGLIDDLTGGMSLKDYLEEIRS